MESNSVLNEVILLEDVTNFEDKLAIFLSPEETYANHPLNRRIHNPYQYVYNADSFTCLVACKFCLKNFIKIEEAMMNYLTDNK